MRRTRPGYHSRRIRHRVASVASTCALVISGASCGATEPWEMPWPPTGDWRLTAKSTVVDVSFGPAEQKCTILNGSFGNENVCETRMALSGRIRELADGRAFTLRGGAVEASAFNIFFGPVGSDGSEASNLAGCASTGYQFTGLKDAPDIDGELTVTCYSRLIAGRILISADEILWVRTEHARMARM